MPGQRTIELVPITLANPTSYKPPMTSKQVKRAYQKANQFKGITRAELRRIEVEEIARQRKEFQKEKAKAKARASREAKAAKALAEVQTRKNSGIIAQSDKIARSRSQKSISDFTRNLCSIKRGRQIINKAEEDDSDSWKKRSKEKKQDEEPSYINEPPKKRIATDPESSESEFDGFPFCSQLEMIVTSIDSKDDHSSQMTLAQPQKLPISKSKNIKLKGLSENRPMSEGIHKDILQGSVQQVAVQQISEKYEAIPKPDIGSSANHSELCLENEGSAKFSCLPYCRNSQNNKSGDYCINRSYSPIKLQNTSSSISNNPLVKDGKVDTKLNLSPKMNSPFSAHVLLRKHSSDDFLSLSNPKTEDYIDDCLDVVDFPSNTQIMTEISAECSAHCDHSSIKTPERPLSSNSRSANFDDLICTQDLVILSQELREIISLIPLEPKPSMNETKASTEISKEKKRFFEEKEEDLLKAALYESKMMVTSINSITDTLKESMERELAFSAPTSHTPPPVTSLPPRSSLSSPATDYGTDEFVGDDWEELSALY
ncbi:hypothetical protein Golomagni_04660 [Golovinomyces magnicellulatus]|nr:hypothetical protein Golomagni_04660 [Golovinomyces magnicellulatus]